MGAAMEYISIVNPCCSLRGNPLMRGADRGTIAEYSKSASSWWERPQCGWGRPGRMTSCNVDYSSVHQQPVSLLYQLRDGTGFPSIILYMMQDMFLKSTRSAFSCFDDVLCFWDAFPSRERDCIVCIYLMKSQFRSLLTTVIYKLISKLFFFYHCP